MTVRAATVLPYTPEPAEIEWTLAEHVGQFRPVFGYEQDQRVRYGVSRWRATIRYRKIAYDDRAAILQFCSKVGKHTPFWVTDWANDIRGSWSLSNLASSSELASFWTANTNRSVIVDTKGVRIAKTGATTASGAASAALTVTSGGVYAYRAIAEFGGAAATIQVGLSAGATANATGYGNLAVGNAGRKVLKCLPSSATMYANVHDSLTDAANWPTLPWYVVRGVNVCSAFETDGGSVDTAQVGSGLYVKSLPVSTSGVLKAGDLVEIVTSGFAMMLRLVEDLNSDSAGKAFMRFEPQLRGPVYGGNLLIPHRPQVQMVLAEDPAFATAPPRYLSGVEITCEEVFG